MSVLSLVTGQGSSTDWCLLHLSQVICGDPSLDTWWFLSLHRVISFLIQGDPSFDTMDHVWCMVYGETYLFIELYLSRPRVFLLLTRDNSCLAPGWPLSCHRVTPLLPQGAPSRRPGPVQPDAVLQHGAGPPDRGAEGGRQHGHRQVLPRHGHASGVSHVLWVMCDV